MIDWIEEYFLGQPSRITNTGRNLVWFGGMLLVLGAIGRVIKFAANLPMGNGGVTGTKMLDDIYPGLLFWLPEGWIGLAGALLLMALGWWLRGWGQQLDRFMR